MLKLPVVRRGGGRTPGRGRSSGRDVNTSVPVSSLYRARA